MKDVITRPVKSKRHAVYSRLKSAIDNFVKKDIPLPEIVEPDKGFPVYVYIEESCSGDFVYSQESIYFWPGVLRYYTGLRPVKKIILSNISYIAPGISPLYKGSIISNDDVFTFEEHSPLTRHYSTSLDISKIDQFFDLEVDSNFYRGEENLFSMTLQIEDFLGNRSNRVLLNFICYDGN